MDVNKVFLYLCSYQIWSIVNFDFQRHKKEKRNHYWFIISVLYVPSLNSTFKYCCSLKCIGIKYFSREHIVTFNKKMRMQ